MCGRVNRDATDINTGAKPHRLRIPTYTTTTTFDVYIYALYLCSRLFNEVLVLIFIVKAIKLAEPFKTGMIRLNGFKVVPKVRTGDI